MFAALIAAVFLFPFGAALGSATTEPPASTDDAESAVLGTGDWVSIQIAGQPDVTSYVAADGTITVPLVGNVPVAGISSTQVANRVAKALKDGGYLVDPQVTVQVTQPQTQTVSVVGEVQKQGRYPLSARTSVIDLLALAGGTKDTASDLGYVVRTDDAGQVSRYPVNLNVLTNSNEPPPTWTLRGGDRLVVPRAEHFSVEGEVSAPGRYRIEPGMTVMQAIARAGGITARGSEHRIQLKRAEKPGQYKTLHANLGDPVKADDIIRVKEALF